MIITSNHEILISSGIKHEILSLQLTSKISIKFLLDSTYKIQYKSEIERRDIYFQEKSNILQIDENSENISIFDE